MTMFYGSMFFGTQPQLIFAKKTYIISLLTMVSIILNIGINIPFIMKWGAIGASRGTLLSGLISGSISFAVSQYYYKIEWEYKKIAYIFMSFFAFSILFLFLQNSNFPYPILLTIKLITLLIYAFIGHAVRIISAENYYLVKGILTKLKVNYRPTESP